MTILTWADAKKLAKKNPGTCFDFNAGGNSKAAYCYYCSDRKRIISYQTNDGKIWF